MALLLAAGAHLSRGDAFSHHRSTQRYEDVYYLPSPTTLAVASLGHREALADLIWLRTLVYFGDELIHGGTKVNMLRYADAMLSLDPYFKRIYQWVGTVALYRDGPPNKKDMWTAVRYLENGMRLFPNDGALAWNLGATYAYELVQGELDPAKRLQFKVKGHEYIRVAVLRGAAPDWVAAQTARHFAQLGRKEEAVRHLREVLATVTDPKAKADLEVQLVRLEGEAFVYKIRAFRETFEKRKKANYPYLPAGLFALVGERLENADIAQLVAKFEPALEAFEREASTEDDAQPVAP